MEDATPIFNLQNDTVRKEPIHVMSYNEVLQNMQNTDTTTPVQTPLPGQTPLQGQTPVLPPAVETVPLKQSPNTLEEDTKTFQNDMIVLLSVYVIVHMQSMQEWIQSKVPNMVNPTTGAMSVLGLLMNGLLVIVLWNVSKKMVSKYLKEL